MIRAEHQSWCAVNYNRSFQCGCGADRVNNYIEGLEVEAAAADRMRPQIARLKAMTGEGPALLLSGDKQRIFCRAMVDRGVGHDSRGEAFVVTAQRMVADIERHMSVEGYAPTDNLYDLRVEIRAAPVRKPTPTEVVP